MGEPELKFEIDEHGRIGYRVTNEGVLLSKDEKEFIIDHVMRMQVENAKLRALLIDAFVEFVRPYGDANAVHEYSNRMREVGIEVE